MFRTLHCTAGTHMSLIHPCQLSAANSLDYLVERQRHARNLAARSTEWMSWKSEVKGSAPMTSSYFWTAGLRRGVALTLCSRTTSLVASRTQDHNVADARRLPTEPLHVPSSTGLPDPVRSSALRQHLLNMAGSSQGQDCTNAQRGSLVSPNGKFVVSRSGEELSCARTGSKLKIPLTTFGLRPERASER
jgi:hypothetical protein